MQKILINSLSENGMKILNEMYQDNKKETLQQRIAIKLSGYKAKLILKEPCQIEINFKRRFFKHPVFSTWIYTFVEELTKQINKKGLIKDMDYKIEVI